MSDKWKHRPVWLALLVGAVAVSLVLLLIPRHPNLDCVEKAVAGFDCASIIPDLDYGAVSLKGHVSSEDDHEYVLHKVVSACSIERPVTDHIKVIPRPFCQVMELLTPVQDEAAKHESPLTVNPSKGCDGTYYDGENIAVEVSAKKPLGYLYVDYYDAAGVNVTHLLPNQYTQNSAFNDVEKLSLPGANDRWRMKVKYPFGREMVAALSSPKPLFLSPRPPGEVASHYLASLREAIRAERGGVTASYCFTMSAAASNKITDGIFLDKGIPLANPRVVSYKGLKLTEDSEGFVPTMYVDFAGYCSIAFGHLIKTAGCDGTEPKEFRNGISFHTGQQLLARDMEAAEAAVLTSVRSELLEGQYAALCDFVYNVGAKNFRDSTLLKVINRNQIERVPGQFRRWILAAGKPVPGLVTRREREITLFFDGLPELRAEAPVGENLPPIDIRVGER